MPIQPPAYAYLSNCFSQQPLTGPCLALDADASGAIDLADFAVFPFP